MSFAYGLHSQIQTPQLYDNPLCSTGLGGGCPELLDMNKAHHLVLGYQNQVNNSTKITIEAYYQYLFNIPHNPNRPDISAINFLESRSSAILINNGNGQNYGVELNIQKILLDDYYLIGNISLFESQYETTEKQFQDTRWNSNYIFNLTGGKEWKWQKERKQMIFGANMNLSYLGGFRERAVNEVFSRELRSTVFSSGEFSINQPDFFKTDLRFYLKRNKAKYNTTLALDIQNMTNQKNVAYNYYDSVQDKIVTKYQLGLIPILSWRIEW